MTEWPSSKARQVLAALLQIGWRIKREERVPPGPLPPRMAGLGFAFHDRDEIGPRMLKRIAKRTGLKPEDL